MKAWSEARRARQVARIRRQKPWLHSTGPKSAGGKGQSALNARKHDMYSAEMNAIRAHLRAWRRELKDLTADDR
ncbi:hypothetical protein [Methylovirgula sp. 4M-Z18]|uniref:hypothetical protein n=1 Tax=Methylovirgula sp. 4M-Z18 TaxID=2293567 RepID=UPI000E2E6898|nr:hypothetical protein [Methylovirgula sp. 4M-Z18]